MDAQTFFGLVPTRDPRRWQLEVVPGLTSGLGALFGGCGLGAAIEVLETVTGRPCVWATAQFLSYARPPAVVALDATEAVRGHRISQARVVARVGDEEIFTVNAALGSRPIEVDDQWAQRPDVPPPDESPPRPVLDHMRGTLSDRIDMRLAAARRFDELPGPRGSGNSSLWIRVPEIDGPSAATLAIIGDFVPFGISQALGRRAGGNSLDNTLRVTRRAPSAWVLADVRVHAVSGGFGHGLVHLWSETGQLLGTASQSTIMRIHEDPVPHQPQPEAETTPTGGSTR